MRWACYEERMEGLREMYKTQSENLKGKEFFRDRDITGNLILKLSKIKRVDWTRD